VLLGAALVISGFAFVVGAICGEQWGPAGGDASGLFVVAGVCLILGAFTSILAARGRGVRRYGDRFPGVNQPDLDSEIKRLLAISRRSAWRTQALNYARVLYDELRAVDVARTAQPTPTPAQQVSENLFRAAEVAASKRGGLVESFTGVQRETTWNSLHAAEERLLLIQAPAVVRRRLPGINTALRNTLPPEDPRLDEYTKRLATIATAGDDNAIERSRQSLVGIVKDINVASDIAHANVRAERNTILEIGVVAVVALVVVSVINALSPRFLDLSTASTGHGPRTWWIVVMGFLGGVIGALATKYRVRGAAADDNSLPAVQAFIRIPMGGTVALGAVVLIQSGLVGAVKAQRSLALLGIALVVGYTPDLVLKYLDRRLNKVTGEARSKDDPERPKLSEPTPPE
jgi:hypothetical protein